MNPRIRVLDVGQDKPVLVIDRASDQLDNLDAFQRRPDWAAGAMVFPFEVDIEGTQQHLTQPTAEITVDHVPNSKDMQDSINEVIRQQSMMRGPSV